MQLEYTNYTVKTVALGDGQWAGKVVQYLDVVYRTSPMPNEITARRLAVDWLYHYNNGGCPLTHQENPCPTQL